MLSLTTIPPRFGEIGQTLRKLLNQTHKPDEIRLNLCRSYRRFPGEIPSLPSLPDGITVHWSDVDYGPATKILPTIDEYRGQDVEVIFCDDDQIYLPTFVETLLSRRAMHPDSCIVSEGYKLNRRHSRGHRFYYTGGYKPKFDKRKKGFLYRTKRISSLFLYKSKTPPKEGYVDILEGFGGVLVRPSFFPPEVFDIPDILWTVDDPWLSGHITRMDIPIFRINEKVRQGICTDIHQKNPLFELVYNDHNRTMADTLCIEYFRRAYNIWPGRRGSSVVIDQKSLDSLLMDFQKRKSP